MEKTKKYTKWVALSMVMANMIGVGVFTSLGYQVLPPEHGGIPNAATILIIWTLGGIIALCGAFAYTEIATTYKESGGEYTFLTKLYHPALGFISGWVSLLVGFAGAIAASAIVIGQYSAPFLGIDTDKGYYIFGEFVPNFKFTSIIAIIALSMVHMRGVKTGGMVQNILTGIKVSLIAFFCVAPFFVSDFEPSSVDFSVSDTTWEYVFSLPFAGSLVWVMYSYSGWNASAYIAGNVENPKRSLPFSLVLGTGLVTVIYVVINAVFMYSSEFSQIAGQEEVGNIVAINLFGDDIGVIFSGIFSIAMISTMSAMMIAGPKVTESMGKDYSIFRKLTTKSHGGTPIYAIILQGIIAIVLVMISSFQELIQTIGFILFLFSLLTVIGVFIIRYKKQRGLNLPGSDSPGSETDVVKTWGYPVTPIIFILATIWMIIYFVKEDPSKLLYALIILVPGAIIYFLAENKKNEDNPDDHEVIDTSNSTDIIDN